MKSFKEYLTESKKVYEFKIKLAGDFKDAAQKIKLALAQYDVASVSAGSRLPIAEQHSDFPEYKNVNVTIFDVALNYPTNAPRVRAAVANGLNCSENAVKIRSFAEQQEDEINHAHDNLSGESLLEKDYPAEGEGQGLVGETQKMALLKELSKVKHAGDEVEGVNPKIVAKKAPTEKVSAPKVKQNNKSPVAGKKAKLTPVKGL